VKIVFLQAASAFERAVEFSNDCALGPESLSSDSVDGAREECYLLIIAGATRIEVHISEPYRRKS
jgi:hypothetical protein